MQKSKFKNQNLKLKFISSKTFGFILLLLTFAFCLLPFSKVFAQSQDAGKLDLTVSPPVIELAAKPGQKVTEKFRVRNNLQKAVSLSVSARRLISDPTSGNPTPESNSKGEELKWVTFDNPKFTANPREWNDVTFTIDIPESASYGYYYVFSISPSQDEAIATTGAEVKGEILVVTLLTVLKDGANSKTDLVSFKAKNNISEYLPVDFIVKLANKGNVHVKPRGNIFITRSGGDEIGILEVNEGVGSILPGGQREFTSSWRNGFLVKEPIIENGDVKMDESGNPVTKLTINWNKLTDFRIGPYTARLLMVYDEGSRDVTIEGTTTFWVIPYTALAIILITLIVLFIIIRFVLKWYVRRAIAKSKSR